MNAYITIMTTQRQAGRKTVRLKPVANKIEEDGVSVCQHAILFRIPYGLTDILCIIGKGGCLALLNRSAITSWHSTKLVPLRSRYHFLLAGSFGGGTFFSGGSFFNFGGGSFFSFGGGSFFSFSFGSFGSFGFGSFGFGSFGFGFGGLYFGGGIAVICYSFPDG